MSFKSRYRKPSIAGCAGAKGIGVYDTLRGPSRLLRSKGKDVRTRQRLANIKFGTYYSGHATGRRQLKILEGIV
jgi:hypothetical protein